MEPRSETDFKTPQFNSGIAYLQRIDALFRAAHEASINSNLQNYYLVLVELHTELLPRMKDSRKAESLENFCGKIYLNKNSMGEVLFRKKLLEWSRELHAVAHSAGLIMPDAEGGAAATKL